MPAKKQTKQKSPDEKITKETAPAKPVNMAVIGGLVLFTVLGCAYITNIRPKFDWFSWHPISMFVAFVACAGPAIHLKRCDPSDASTGAHASLNFLAVCLATFGWYVIYTHKESKGFPHTTSNHALVGSTALTGYLLQVCGVFMKEVLPKNFEDFSNLIHRWSGRLSTVLGWAAIILGFMSLEPDMMFTGLFAAPLVILGAMI